MSFAKKVTILILSAIIILLYISFLLLDLNSPYESFTTSDVLKYLSICVCFVISLLIGKDYLTYYDKRFLQLGLFLTTISDFCLVILDKFSVGVAVFCLVQLIYIIRLNPKSFYKVLRNLLSFLLFLFITYFVLKALQIEVKLLYIFIVFYATCLLTSVYSAMKSKPLYPIINYYLVYWGMLLFLLCDINVALYNIFTFWPNINNNMLSNITGYLIWVFYLPSQFLLSISGYNFIKR